MAQERREAARWDEEAAVARLLADPDVRAFLAAMAKAVREAAARANEGSQDSPASDLIEEPAATVAER